MADGPPPAAATPPPPASGEGPTEEDFARLSTPVKVPVSYSCADLYAIFACALLGLPVVVVFLGCMVLVLPPLTIIRAYAACALSRPLETVPRTCGFYAICILAFVLALPLLLLAVAWVAFVRLVIWILCFPIGAVNMSRTRHSWKALRPYSGLPGALGAEVARSTADDLATKFGYVWPFADIVCLCIGTMDRQGFCEFLTALPFMVSVIPVYKYAILTNALLYKLDETYINQWSDPLDANEDGVHTIVDTVAVQDILKRGTCRAVLEKKNRALVDLWVFSGYHQFPPSDRQSRTVAGMQFANQGPLRCALISHTTHPYDVPNHTPKSTHAAWGLIVVRLQSWNPWYHLAGVVEVNYRKDGGVEHPMWLVMDTSSKFAASSLESINRLFVKLGFKTKTLLQAQLPSETRMTE